MNAFLYATTDVHKYQYRAQYSDVHVSCVSGRRSFVTSFRAYSAEQARALIEAHAAEQRRIATFSTSWPA